MDPKKENHPDIRAFIRKRLSRRESYGLRFTIGIAASAFFAFLFAALAQDVIARESLVAADIRIMNLAVVLREFGLARVFLFITYLGNWQSIVSVGILILLILGLQGERRKARYLFVAVLAGELLYSIFKILMHRPRPDISFSLFPQTGYAFPSGHAVVPLVFYGMIAFFLRRTVRKRRYRALIAAGAATFVFLIGYSRIYLGVHWASDVIAGWALGAAILLCAASLFRAREKSSPEIKQSITVPRAALIPAVTFLVFLEGVFAVYFYATHPLRVEAVQAHGITVIAPPDTIESIIQGGNFPKFSETLTGEKMEPVSLIIVGSKDELTAAFKEAGWMTADIWGVRTLLRMGGAAIDNAPYPAAPVTPSFLNAEPETIAFQKATEKNSPRERHHARFWLTQYRFGSRPVWVATASFDEEIRYLITHKIDPNIDAERDFIKTELEGTKSVDALRQIQLVQPLRGKNQIGYEFFTDGKAYIMALK